MNFDENESILLVVLAVQRRRCDSWDCKGRRNLSDGKAFVHKTNLLLPLQLSAERYAHKLAIDSAEYGKTDNNKTITKPKATKKADDMLCDAASYCLVQQRRVSSEPCLLHFSLAVGIA